jgi:hypothetical protein|tara:strand:+ start:4610 stop:4906 length:297 start_codon:yes stop_codon:yes gene_type:complete
VAAKKTTKEPPVELVERVPALELLGSVALAVTDAALDAALNARKALLATTAIRFCEECAAIETRCVAGGSGGKACLFLRVKELSFFPKSKVSVLYGQR